MTATINATTTTGVVVTSDTSGALALQTANTTAMTISSAQVVNFANTPTIAGSAFPSGAMVLVSSATASNSATIIFTSLSTTYKAYILEYDSVYLATSSDNLCLQLSTDNGSTYLSSGYKRTLILQSSGTVAGNYATTGTLMFLGGINGYSTTASETGNGVFILFAPASSGKIANTYLQSNCTNGGILENCLGPQVNTTTSAVNALKIFGGAGNITGGNFRLYGLVNA